ncbi:MAG: transcription-repair coupling factor [Bacteroidota bacterium]|nr:transcription-repair coupling factor [Bacteroidota bacterium]
MTTAQLSSEYKKHPNYKSLHKFVQASRRGRIQLKGLPIEQSPLPVSAVLDNSNRPHFFCLFGKEKAAYFYNDLQQLLPDKDIMFLPSSYRRSAIKSAEVKPDSGSVVLRTEILNKIISEKAPVIISYTEAVAEKVPALGQFKSNSFELKKGKTVKIDKLTKQLQKFGFVSQDFVYEPGQYSQRGSIVDIFSYSNDFPFRIDFFDNEIESIRTFDIVTQLSKSKFETITIVPDIRKFIHSEELIYLTEYLNKDTIVWTDDLEAVKSKFSVLTSPEDSEFINADKFINALAAFSTVECSAQSYFDVQHQLEYNFSEQPAFNKNFEMLAADLIERNNRHYTSVIISDHEDQLNRIKKLLYSEEIADALLETSYSTHPIADKSEAVFDYKTALGNLSTGFIDRDMKFLCYTDHQIFGRYYKFQLKTASFKKSRESISLKELNDLKPGDFVVHSDHGIGKFGGLHPIDINGKIQEAVRLYYKDDDILLVNIHNLHKISKYAGKESGTPKIYKLGSKTWANLKNRTKGKVKDIAEELIKLYAARKAEKGFAFSGDTFLQHDLESSFMYDDTPDQAKTSVAVKSDMEAGSPMDRLVVGDVGFGKTEIAIRAAFKAAYDGKQTAILVPTTVLTLQHYKTFEKRFRDYPIAVDFLSRFKTAKEIKETLKRLSAGKIDIVIGTHRLISKDVKFYDLGLLIVDEEQKFGVGVKDKLKKIKLNVDTLTLTATPIPRTLQFSLNGARDMSVINTAPPNRYPIETEVHRFDKKIIKEVLNYEISRGGQAFIIHNRIDNIREIENMVHRISPNISTAVVHGRMKPKEVEKVMAGFINEEYGVLIATSIIESGLDIPNANTIIINNAQNFGLSDLHQLRGRVGRSDKKAFCYLLAPPKHMLNNEAQRRLEAAENFSELGSGMNIAMRDLDIRGAGNLLGGQQSGFIADVGFETYHQILDEALNELKEKQYRSNFTGAEDTAIPKDFKYVADCSIDTDFEILFPTSYIQNLTERLKLYRQLDKIAENGELYDFRKNLIDRFGELPEESEDLLKAVVLRRLGIELGMEKIFLKRGLLRAYFVSDQESSYYQSQIFTAVLGAVQKYPKNIRLAEKKNKLTLTIKNIQSVSEAVLALEKIEEGIK